MKNKILGFLLAIGVSPFLIAATPTADELVATYKQYIRKHTAGLGTGKVLFSQRSGRQLELYAELNKEQIMEDYLEDCAKFQSGVDMVQISKERTEAGYQDYLQTGNEIHKAMIFFRSNLVSLYCRRR